MSTNKKTLSLMTAVVTVFASFLGFLAVTHAAVNVTTQTTSLITNPITLPANSQQTALFTFSLNATAGETLSNVMVQIDKANASTTVTSGDLASLSVYRDDGSGVFDPSVDTLVGSQATVNIGTPTIVNSSTTTLASGKFYVSLATSGTWSDASPADSITATMFTNAILTSLNSPTTVQVTTSAISADVVAPQIVSAVAQNTGGTSAKEAGDSIVITFSEPTNMLAIGSSTLSSQFTLNNGHSFLDSLNNLGSASFNATGNVLTIVLSQAPSSTLPTVMPGDVLTVATTTGITDLAGNKALGQVVISGDFGNLLTPVVTTAIHNASHNATTTAAVGAIVHDSITVTGATTTPSGNVTLSFFNNGSCANSPAATSSAMVLVSGTVDATAFAQGPLQAGSYSFMAHYNGDANYAVVNGACEPLTVATVGKNQVTITTQLSATSTKVSTAVHDSATLNGATANAGGSVTYNVYANNTCSGTPVFTSSQTVTNGIVPMSANFTATSTGTYNWQAVYSGDANNTTAKNDCGSEVLVVTKGESENGNEHACSNGLINGRLYMIKDWEATFMAVNCQLKVFKGNAVGHAQGEKFQNIITLPSPNGITIQTQGSVNSEDKNKSEDKH